MAERGMCGGAGGGMYGGRHTWQGAYMMNTSGWYASHWNASCVTF